MVPLFIGSAMHKCPRGVSDAKRAWRAGLACVAHLSRLHTRSRGQIAINHVLRRNVHHLRNRLAVHLHVVTACKDLKRFKGNN